MRHVFSALFRRLRFFCAARTRHDVHSPFIAELVEQVLEDKRWYYAFTFVEMSRRRWLRDGDAVSASPYGAGTLAGRKPADRAGEIVRRSAVNPETGRRLFRIACWLKPRNIIELGTSMGVSTAYLASANRQTRVITIEGNGAVAKKARSHFEALHLDNIQLIEGSFNEKLPEALRMVGQIDMIFIDGDHREEAVLRYVRMCMEYSHEKSVFLIADIHWSAEMERAWKKLCAWPEVTLSVDLFHMGLLFLRREFREKQHLGLVPAWWKPWRIGVL